MESVEFYSASRDHMSFEAGLLVRDGGKLATLFQRSALRDPAGEVARVEARTVARDRGNDAAALGAKVPRPGLEVVVGLPLPDPGRDDVQAELARGAPPGATCTGR